MPIIVNNKTVTDNYADTEVGGHGAYYAYGTLLVTNNPVAVLLGHGVTGGQSSPLELLYLPPGTYPLYGFQQDWITGLQIKNAVKGQVPAATVSVLLFEPNRAGIAPSAVINPLASKGITQVTSVDGSVTITNAFGPVVDLSVPGISGFLHWGTNNDTGHLGLTLNAVGDVLIDTGGAHSFTVTATIGNFNISNTWNSIVSNGSTGLAIGSVGLLTLGSTTGQVLIQALHDIQAIAHGVAGSGGASLIQADTGVTIQGGNNGVIINAPSFGLLSPAGAVRLRDPSGNDVLVISNAPTLDAYLPLALHGPTGATAATRYAGGTTTGAPASGTFAKGDYVVAQDGAIWVCTVAGTPGTWINVGTPGGGVSSFAKSGDTPITGAVTISAGTNIALTEVGQNVQIAAVGAGVTTELDYVERTTDLTVTATSAATATAFITGNSVAYDGSTRVRIEWWINLGLTTNANNIVAELYEDSTDLGRIGHITLTANTAIGGPMYGVRFLTPSNASHTYSIRIWKTGAGLTTASGASPALPAFLRITRA